MVPEGLVADVEGLYGVFPLLPLPYGDLGGRVIS